jgi:hypothetical protein
MGVRYSRLACPFGISESALMTIAFSGVLPDLIVMTVDSAVTLDFEKSREYVTGRKAYFVAGVGNVTTWGTRDCNSIGEFLDKQKISSATHSVEELADLVNQYLIKEYRPRELGLDDVGYHVAGFNRQRAPRLYHIFWGFDRSRPANQTSQKYEKYDHSPSPGTISYLYNGRNDLAEIVVRTLLNEVEKGAAMRFDPRTHEGLVRLGDLVVRFAAEVTPEVGPPFFTYLISPRNKAVTIKNEGICPINLQTISQKLRKLFEEDSK